MRKLALLFLVMAFFFPSQGWATAPTLTSIAPNSNISTGGAFVTLTGTNFIAGATVTIGGNSCATLTVVSATSITCYAPPGTAETTVDVVVTTSGGSATLVNGFRYGQILISDGFESGTYSAWDATHDLVNETVVTAPLPVHSGTYSARMYYHRCGNPSLAPVTGQTTGGDQPGTYYVKYTYADGTHETIASSEVSQVVTASHLLIVTGPAKMVDISGWNVYVSTSAGTETLQNATPIDCSSGTCANWTEPVGGLIAGVSPPGSTTGCGTPDKNEWFMYAFMSHGYPSGASHTFTRGYVYFAQPTDPLAVLGTQRKLIYHHGGSGGGEWNSVLIADPNRPSKYVQLRIHTNDYVTPPDGIGPVDCYGATGVTDCAQGAGRFACVNTLGTGSCWSAAADAANMNLNWDTWYYLEMEHQSNASGYSDGIIRVWVNGVLWFEATNLHMRSSGTTVGIHRTEIGNQTNEGVWPYNEYRYWDDVVIADAYIGPRPSVFFNPISYVFNSTKVGNTSPGSPQTIILTNNGSATLNISGISITGTNPGDFSQGNTCGATLAASASCNINTSFTPLALGSRSAFISVADDAPGSPQTVPISGTGTSGSAPAVDLSVSALYFDPRIVGTTSAARVITLYNSGDATLNITSIVASTTSAPTSPGDFAIASTTCGATLPAAASCQVNVSFTPVAGGNRTGRVRFTTDAASSPDDVSTSGTGQIVLTLRGGTFRISKN